MGVVQFIVISVLVRLGLCACPETAIPLEYWMVGEKVIGHAGCAPEEKKSTASLEVAPYGVIMEDMFPWPIEDKNDGCAEEIVVIFTKSDAAPYLIYRRNVKADYFAETHPEVYNAYIGNGSTGWLPCSEVAVQKVLVWGTDRQLFISLIRKAVKMARYIRDYACYSYGQPPNTTIVYEQHDIDAMLRRNRVATSVLSFLHAIAHSNFFCV